MRFLLVLLAAFVFSPAIAAPIEPDCWPRVPGSAAVAEQLHFFPVDNADRFFRDQSAFWVATWWCRGKYDNTVALFSGNRSDLPSLSEIWGIFTTFPYLTPQQRTTLFLKYTTKTMSPERRAKAWELLSASRPERPKWIVAKNGSTLDRPVFAVVNGVRSTSAVRGVRYTVGAVCACNVRALEEGKSSYCPTYGDPTNIDRVTLCTEG